MAALRQACAEYELDKYLQLFHGDEAFLLAGDAAVRGSLNDRIELTTMRLVVHGAFLVLNDAKRLHLIAGGHRADVNRESQVEFYVEDPAWLHIGAPDRSAWISLFQEISTIHAHSSSERVVSIPTLRQDPRTSKLAAVSGPEHLSFFAGIALTSHNGHNIGAVCVVDQNERPPLSASEAAFLADTAQRCMALLELARERSFHNRWTAVQEELDIFLKSRSLHAQLLEEPQTPAGRKLSDGEDDTERARKPGNERVNPDTLAEDTLTEMDNPPAEGSESKRLMRAEFEESRRIAEEDNNRDARSLTARRGRDDERGFPKGETPYRKVFRRAAECLRSALNADGVLFIDGLVGFHGDIQPVAEPEQELERETARPLQHPNKSTQEDFLSSNDFTKVPEGTFNPHDPDPPGTHSRIYTSAEYLKGFYGERPAEVIGISGATDALKLVRVSGSTIGLPDIDEGFLQRLMDRHPKGAVWHHFNNEFMQVKDETLVEVDLQEEARRLKSTFRNVQQLMFKPLTDPTSLKRIGGCFAWRNEPTPLFTDAVDLASVKAFLHVVETEIARYDAAAAAKQRESFVSSVSHELRTPLHGILGAVQLLDQTELDPMQKSLAEMVTTCGSTLHETLTSVLSYAKINQFERRQHEYRQRRPPDSSWALSDKEGLASGPDRDYKGLYICTNVALLCEELVGVLEAGKSFQDAHGGEVAVVCNIGYQENWCYYTEPGALRRIAANLIGNALKYTKGGSVVVTLSASRLVNDAQRVSNDLATGRTITFTIRDTGKGMSKEFMDNELFLPFTQEDSTSSSGVGLGMSIVKSLTSLLAGEIIVQSEQNKGTEINVRIPMRMSTSDDEEKGQATLDFERELRKIRDQKLSAIIYGFPQYIRESLRTYLRDWYGCNLLDPTASARPDIVLVDEGNEEVVEAVKETAHKYGSHGVLLSVVTAPSRLGTQMTPIDGYTKWVRVPRPLGPRKVAQGLLSCIEKLGELQKYDRYASSVDQQGAEEKTNPTEESTNLQRPDNSLLDEMCTPSVEKLQVSEASQSPLGSPALLELSPASIQHFAEGKEAGTAGYAHGNSGGHEGVSHTKSSVALRILIVDDNAINLKLLRTFFQRKGYGNTKQAMHGKEAVEAVQDCNGGFDIILMDLSMPIMDGFEATRQIRKMEAGCERTFSSRESVIIALTGLASQADEDEAFKAGVDLFLTKPVQFAKLSKLLRDFGEGTLKRRDRSDG